MYLSTVTGIITAAAGGWEGWFRPLAAAPALSLDGGQGRFKPEALAITPPEEEDKASGIDLRRTTSQEDQLDVEKMKNKNMLGLGFRLTYATGA
jgi:hypothetical protein